MATIDVESGRVAIHASSDTPLPELSNLIQFGIAWMLGSKGHRMKIERSRPQRSVSSPVVVMITPMVKLEPLQYSGYSLLEGLCAVGFFPKILPENERHPMARKIAQDGQNRTQSSAEGSVFVRTTERPKANQPKLSVSTCAFGLADACVEHFIEGATVVQYGLSLLMEETFINVGMTESEAHNYVRRSRCYDPEQTVRSLPWTNGQ